MVQRKSSDKIPTATLLTRIFSTKNIKSFVFRNKEHLKLPTLAEHLSELCAQKGMKPKDVVKNADMDRFYGAEIFSGKRSNPSREYLIRLALGLGISYKECQRLLTVAGKSPLYPRVEGDAVIIKCLHSGLGYQEAEYLLFEMGLPTLK
ncbi:MAG: helix-turn-helix domain-containing protein [Oscillospiraceae bacterium]|nr:helix-turn-helix domain-containing protein [Oscillospiraceae bacterium]